MLYVQATPTGASRLRLQAVVGVGSGGGVPPRTLTTVTVAELTTVALVRNLSPSGLRMTLLRSLG